MGIKPQFITSLNGLLPSLCSAVCLSVALWLAAVSLLCILCGFLLSRRLPPALIPAREQRFR